MPSGAFRDGGEAGRYLFADEDLEGLSAGQKMLLRIGSANAVVIMNKLQEVRDAITRQKL